MDGILPISECTDEVIAQVANTITQWAMSITTGTMDDPDATPVSNEAIMHRELVQRLSNNPDMSHSLELPFGEGDASSNAANGIFWFCQGWRAAEAAMLVRMPRG